MSKKYRGFICGDYHNSVGEVYCFDIPLPDIFNSYEEAEKDAQKDYGLRFGLEPKTGEPCVFIFEKENFTVGQKADGTKYLNTWLEGNIIKKYSFKEFKKLNGVLYIQHKNAKNKLVVNMEKDYSKTNKSFKEIFIEKDINKLYYIDNESYYINEI